jgi:hypothetical protein
MVEVEGSCEGRLKKHMGRLTMFCQNLEMRHDPAHEVGYLDFRCRGSRIRTH